MREVVWASTATPRKDQHGIIGAERQEAGGGVRLAGVDEVDALGNPLGLPDVIHNTEIGPDRRHARDRAGFHVQRQRKLARRGKAEARRAGAEGTPAA